MVFSQLLITMFKVVLMNNALGIPFLLKYMLARNGAFHLFQLMRCNWYYMLPLTGVARVVMSALFRTFAFEIGSSLSFLQMRHRESPENNQTSPFAIN